MGEGFLDKTKGKARELGGKAQEEWGEATNDPNTEAQGEASENKAE